MKFDKLCMRMNKKTVVSTDEREKASGRLYIYTGSHGNIAELDAVLLYGRGRCYSFAEKYNDYNNYCQYGALQARVTDVFRGIQQTGMEGVGWGGGAVGGAEYSGCSCI